MVATNESLSGRAYAEKSARDNRYLIEFDSYYWTVRGKSRKETIRPSDKNFGYGIQEHGRWLDYLDREFGTGWVVDDMG